MAETSTADPNIEGVSVNTATMVTADDVTATMVTADDVKEIHVALDSSQSTSVDNQGANIRRDAVWKLVDGDEDTPRYCSSIMINCLCFIVVEGQIHWGKQFCLNLRSLIVQ